MVNDAFATASVFYVPMKDSAPLKPVPSKLIDVDASSLCKEGLETLKKQDPFLYYSIPGVRTAVVGNESVEMSSLNSNQSSMSVERRSCVSVECDVLHLGLHLGLGGLNNDDAPVHKRRRRWSFNAGSKFQKAI
jgi:hypothetical protein